MLDRTQSCCRNVRILSRQCSTSGSPRRSLSMEPTEPVRVRFAPSPTGMLHLGGLRTALFNYLLARKYGGSFILRIEDTDQKRLVPGATESIVRTLEWAGLQFDEGPGKGGPSASYLQSQRGDLYRTHANELLEKGAAYRCFCDSKRLESLRAEATLHGRAPMYDRRCAHLSQQQIDNKLRAGEPHTIRLLAPNAADPAASDVSGFDDIVHGEMRFRGPAGFDDAVLLKSDGLPTYHLANVVDDHLMGITHVLRGEEWLMSTPKHRALFKAFGWPMPRYAHLPLLMNPDGSKLSKRNRDGPMQSYIDEGYLPSALVNYVALLGWHPGGQQEVYSLKELEDAFSLSGLSRSKSVVSRERLDWLNRQHLRTELNDPARAPAIAAQALVELRQTPELDTKDISREAVEQALRLCGDRLTLTRDLYGAVPYLFSDPDSKAPVVPAAAVNKVPRDSKASILVAALELLAAEAGVVAGNSCTSSAGLERWMDFSKNVAVAAKVPAKQVMPVLRHALTGQPSGPKLPDLMDYLSLATMQRRVQTALDSLKQ
ncbi:Glutamate--tRNA ligase mitochondrial [Coemansia sp. S155-1]|nr:Glutamate--tRNA ligase mitochondrial [Coemansia sp. S155-1]